MEKITVNGSTSYDVLVEHGIIDRAGELLRYNIGGEKAFIVTDSNVATLYLSKVSDSLKEAGYEVSSIVLASGESTKSVENYTFLMNLLSEHDFAKTDLVVALGGGVIGDLTGFVASTFKRGIRLVQMPTSLLSAVDSSIGGKTAINLPAAKNQVGTIYNPAMVICDPSLMLSLSEVSLKDGYAEIIKYGILSGYDIIEALRAAIDTDDYTSVICQAISTKRDVVEMDEGDTDFRQYLNLGHLIGHAIEANADYEIPHGAAVARGLAWEARSCAFAGYTVMSTYMEISALLEEFGFDVSEAYNIDELMPYIMRDKRIRDGVIQILTPVHIGECIMRPLSANQLETFVKLGL